MLRRLLRLLVVLSVVFILAVAALWVFTNTNFGRERVRRYALQTLGGATHGIVKLGALHGDLLRGATFAGVSITDSAGRPFLAADSLSAHYGLRGFLSQKVILSDVVLYHPVVVIEKLPHGEWNYRRLWPQTKSTGPTDSIPGWGSTVRFENTTVINGDITVLSPWEPRPGESARVRDSLITAALGDQSRIKVIRAPGGFQKVVSLQKVDAQLPLVRIADPAFKNRYASVAALRMLAYPFRPPAAQITALTGNFSFNDDSLWWKGANARLPNSALTGDGTYNISNGDMKLTLAANPAASKDFRWVYPNFPVDGGGKMGLVIVWKGATQDYVVRDADVHTGTAHLLGDIGFTLTDTVFFHDANVRFTGVTTKLIESLVPGLKSPRQGVLSGRAKFSGTLKRMALSGTDVTFAAYNRGTSRAIATGVVGFTSKPTVVSARNLHVRVEPLQMDLVKLIFPTLPVGGTLTGVVTLNGSGARQLDFNGIDIVHVDGANRSHAVGRASSHTVGRATLDLDVVARPLALAEINKFAPSLSLKGYATGPVHAHGPIDALRVDTRLALPGNATFAMRGTVDFKSKELGYDVVTRADALDLSRVMAGAPVTSLTGGGSARGRGFKPATMYADLDLRFGPSTVDTMGVDSLVLKARVARGLVTIDRGEARASGAIIDVAGQFGMDARHSGSLSYNVKLDSLGTFARYIPGGAGPDTGVVLPRPRQAFERLMRARADSARVARETEVARAISGRPAPRAVVVDTARPIPRNVISGALQAQGTITGNVSQFDLHGTANGTSLLFRGNAARHIAATYDWTNARTTKSAVKLVLGADTLSAYGFEFDSLAGDLTYAKSNGTVSMHVRQGDTRSYALSGEYTIDKARNQLRLADLALRFDTTTWRSTHPSTIHWGTPGIEVVNLELRSGPTRRIFANGLLPTKGRANFDLSVTDFAVENIAELLQSDLPITGRLNLDAHVQGTSEDPLAKGQMDLVHATYNSTPIPDIHGTFNYANRELTTNARAVDSTGHVLASINGTVPIDLALSGVNGSRLLDLPISATLVSDSLPITLIPQLTDVVTDVSGKATGRLTVTGTLKKPTLRGNLLVQKAQFKLAATGAFFENVNGSVRMTGDTVYVDSIVATANGPVKLIGTVAVGNFRRPTSNLFLTANDALLLNNERGKVYADAGIRLSGPVDSTYVSGQVTVQHGVIFIPASTGKRLVGAGDPALFSVIDTSVASQRELFPAQSPLFKNLHVDVDLAVNRNTWVRSREANVEIFTDGPLRVAVQGDALTLIGAVDADRGEYTFLSRRFQITRGSALFVGTPDINPTLQITAEYQVKQATGNANIKVLIGGTLEQPRISLESDMQPPLSQSELLSFLAFGESSGSLLQLGQSSLNAQQGGNLINVASTRLAAIALGVALDELEGDAARSLGADVFNITPGNIPATNASGLNQFLTGTELEAGWYVSPTTFVTAVATPGALACIGGSGGENSACSTPGVTLTHRTNKGYRFDTSFTPRYFLNQPTLAGQTASSGAQFGAFIIREWRF